MEGIKQRRIHVCTEEIPIFTKEMRERQKDILKVRNNLKAHPVIVEGTSVTYEEVAEITPEQWGTLQPAQREFLTNNTFDTSYFMGEGNFNKSDLILMRFLQQHYNNMCLEIEQELAKDSKDRAAPYYRQYALKGKRW